jgi:hypothetical protein
VDALLRLGGRDEGASMSFENRGRERNRAIVQIPGPGRLFPEPSAQSSSFHGNGRSPSPHLRGNPHLAAQMRSELLQQSHDVQHQGLPQVGAEPAARADGISPEKRKEMEQMLETMGFIDKAVNAAMMRKHNCQLDKVLDDLIAGIGSPSCGAYTPGGDSTRRTDASGAYSRQPVPVEDRRTAPRSLHPSPQHVDNAEHKGTQSLDLASLLGFTCIEGTCLAFPLSRAGCTCVATFQYWHRRSLAATPPRPCFLLLLLSLPAHMLFMLERMMPHADRSDEKVVRAILEKEDQAKAKASTQFGARERILASSSGRQKGFLQVNSVDTATSSVGRPTSLLPASSSHSAGGSASGCAACACFYLCCSSHSKVVKG